MLRPIRLVLVAAAAAALPTVALPGAVLAGQATTTRIETRPFYGATVTLEEGVRVFRPLPYHSKVIINPGGKTPLTLGFEENRTVTRNDGGSADRAARDGRDGGGDRGGGIGGAGFASGDGVAGGAGTRADTAVRTRARTNRGGNGTVPASASTPAHVGGGGKH